MSADFWGLKTAGGTATAYHLLAAMLAKSHALEVPLLTPSCKAAKSLVFTDTLHTLPQWCDRTCTRPFGASAVFRLLGAFCPLIALCGCANLVVASPPASRDSLGFCAIVLSICVPR